MTLDFINNDGLSQPSRLLFEERKKSGLNSHLIHTYICGGEQATQCLQTAYQIIERDPILFMERPFDMTRVEAREKTMAQIKRFWEIRRTIRDPLMREQFLRAMGTYSESFSMKLYVHDMLFRESLKLHGTQDQNLEWQNDIEEMKCIGCFAMTELGHSSFLRGLETTATFDKENDEFIIHSPSITATKWWIGMAGETATHTVALCQLMINGEKKGLYWFIVPLRNMRTGELCPGVTCGDIGVKAGRNGLDNGWIQFSQVRVPRKSMLMKWAQVDRYGNFSVSGNPAIAYSTLIPERLSVSEGVFRMGGQALTIACRYGCARQQGPNEEKIIDYQTQYTQLIPSIAYIYMVRVVDMALMKKWHKIASEVAISQDTFLSQLPDMHAVSAGLKATASWRGTEILEQCRRACGGHAYSSYNGIAGIIGDWGVMTTGGGDNFPLTQQTAKYLLSSFEAVLNENKSLSGSVKFFNNYEKYSHISTISDITSVENMTPLAIFESFKWLFMKKLTLIREKFSFNLNNGMSKESAWNEHLVDFVDLTRFHTIAFTLEIFMESASPSSGDSNFRVSKEIEPIFSDLVLMYSLDMLYRELSHFMRFRFLLPDHADAVERRHVDQCLRLRKHVIPLVDSFGFPDFVLKAPIGRFDGDIYKHYFNTVKGAPNCFGPPDYWNKSVGPLTSNL